MRPVIGLILFVSILTACATVPQPPPPGDIVAAWRARQSELSHIRTWQIRGRFALRTSDQGWHATLNWRRDDVRHRLDITGPLGRGHLRLVQDEQGAELLDTEQQIWRAENPEAVLYRATGWTLPLHGLNYWVLGLPSPAALAVEELDAHGRLKKLAQLGWDIQFLEYTRFGSTELPSKMYLSRIGGAAPESSGSDSTLEVRVSIERWTFAP